MFCFSIWLSINSYVNFSTTIDFQRVDRNLSFFTMLFFETHIISIDWFLDHVFCRHIDSLYARKFVCRYCFSLKFATIWTTISSFLDQNVIQFEHIDRCVLWKKWTRINTNHQSRWWTRNLNRYVFQRNFEKSKEFELFETFFSSWYSHDMRSCNIQK